MKVSKLLGVVLVASVALDAQATDPSTLPRLEQVDLVYVGGWRGPQGGPTHLSYGGQPIAYNPANHSLFVGTMHRTVAEISIPTPVYSVDVKALPAATYLQQPVDPTEGRYAEVTTSSLQLYGLLVHGPRLYGAAASYYDASNMQRVGHFARSLALMQPSFSGWSRVWEEKRTGFVSGYMAAVPAEWQSRLGGSAITGQCCIPIISRTSFGPSAFAFDPVQIGQLVVPATPLLYYPQAHPTLGRWETQGPPNPAFNQATSMGGVALIAGTRTALFVGTTGLGPPCYGAGTADKAKVGTTDPDGTFWCYDPTSSAKGGHAYPYRYQIWAYDLNDFVAVKAGTKQPWEVVPYAMWPLALPTTATHWQIGGVTYNATQQTIYVSQFHAESDIYTRNPVFHAIAVKVATPPSTDAPDVSALRAQIAELQTQIAKLSGDVAASAERFTAFVAALKALLSK